MADARRQAPYVRVDMRIVTEYGPHIGPHALAAYLALPRFAGNTTRTCYPSVPTLARLTGMSRPTATKALRTLQAASLIAITPRRRPSGEPHLTRIHAAAGVR